jgi:tetratricopeptide (TPR) repeat protein
LGMASKEVMVSAPLVVLLYDRTFVAGSFLKAVQQRWRLYAGLAATWGLLAALVGAAAGRSGTAGFGSSMTWWECALTQCQAVVHYLRLACWPDPLVFDYGTVVIKDALAMLPQGLLLAALLAGTLFALWRRPPLGFLGAWFFLILAPSSSIVPVATQTIAEHRMYLSLAAVVVAVVVGLFRWIGSRSMAVFAALAFGLGWATVQRNTDYRSEFALWSDTVDKCPNNAPAYDILGSLWLKQGNGDEATRCLTRALQLQPSYASAHYNLGIALAESGHPSEAVAHFEEALHIEPDLTDAQVNLGNALVQVGRAADAIPHYEAALQFEPGAADVHIDLGLTLARLGRLQEAINHFAQAVRIQPDSAVAHLNLGVALLQLHRTAEAIVHLEQAVRIDPNLMQAREILARLKTLSQTMLPQSRLLRLRYNTSHPDVRARRWPPVHQVEV